jgi:hypothetical protein
VIDGRRRLRLPGPTADASPVRDRAWKCAACTCLTLRSGHGPAATRCDMCKAEALDAFELRLTHYQPEEGPE